MVECVVFSPPNISSIASSTGSRVGVVGPPPPKTRKKMWILKLTQIYVFSCFYVYIMYNKVSTSLLYFVCPHWFNLNTFDSNSFFPLALCWFSHAEYSEYGGKVASYNVCLCQIVNKWGGGAVMLLCASATFNSKKNCFFFYTAVVRHANIE